MLQKTILSVLLFFSVSTFCAQTDTLPPISELLIDQDSFASAGDAPNVTRKLMGKKKFLLDGVRQPIFNQRCEVSCGSCAVVSALMLRYQLYCQKRCKCVLETPVFSWSFLHNQLVKRYGAGKIHMKHVFDLLKSQGILPSSVFSNTPCSHDRQPTKKELKQAEALRHWDYLPIFDAPQKLPGKPEQQAEGFKKQLVSRTIYWIDQETPVVIALYVNDDLRQKLTDQNCLWSPALPLTKPWGHALVVVGYDDDSKEFTLINSYGEKWGCRGLLRIPFETFMEVVKEGYIINFDFNTGRKVECPK